MDKILVFNPQSDTLQENAIASELIRKHLINNRDALTDALFQLNPTHNALRVGEAINRGARRVVKGAEPVPTVAEAQAAAELLETPGAADLLVTRAFLDEEIMKQRERNSQLYKQLFGNG